MAKEKKQRVRRDPTLVESAIAMLAMMVMVSYVIMGDKGDAQMPFIAATAVAAAIAMRAGCTWAELEAGIIDAISAAIQSIIIIMVIGMVIGSWIQGGVVPAMIYYGLKIIDPRFFLLTICIICMIVGLSTGSTYTTAGTIGIAAMGMGSVLGIPAGMTAGAVISGAYFGDKMSPLSDTTCLASGVNKVNIFVHVRHMVWTVTPAVIFAWIMFTVLGLKYAPDSELEMGAIDAMLNGLADNFKLTPLLLLPMALVILMIILQVPALPGILGVSGLGVVCCIYQGHGLTDIIDALHYGYVSETGIESVDTLLTRGGMDSMMWTVSFILVVLAFGGVMDKSGMLRVIIHAILKFVKRDGTVYLCALLTCLLLNIVAADNYVAIVMTARMYRRPFAERGMMLQNLSRICEDVGSVTSPLVPWNTCAIIMSGFLGVSALVYAPYCFLNWSCGIFSAIYGYTGFTVARKDPKEMLAEIDDPEFVEAKEVHKPWISKPMERVESAL